MDFSTFGASLSSMIMTEILDPQEGEVICQMVDMLGDGFISINHLAFTVKGIGNL